jgi:hypothetical protein
MKLKEKSNIDRKNRNMSRVGFQPMPFRTSI